MAKNRYLCMSHELKRKIINCFESEEEFKQFESHIDELKLLINFDSEFKFFFLYCFFNKNCEVFNKLIDVFNEEIPEEISLEEFEKRIKESNDQLDTTRDTNQESKAASKKSKADRKGSVRKTKQPD